MFPTLGMDLPSTDWQFSSTPTPNPIPYLTSVLNSYIGNVVSG